MVKQAVIILGKLLALYLVVPFLWVNLVLMQVALPRFLFVERAFVLSVLFAVSGAALVSLRYRSKLPMLFAVLCILYCSVFLTMQIYAVAFVGMLMLVAAIHFVCPNRFTEPLLVLLPIVAGAWFFLSMVYPVFLAGWVNYVTGRMGYLELVVECLGLLKNQAVQALLALPLLAMYFFARKCHARLFVWARSLFPKRHTR